MRDYALLMEMGTGKTFTMINILRWRFMVERRLMRTLILCPPIVCSTWKREIEGASTFGPDTVILRGAGADRLEILKEEGWDQGRGVGYRGKVFVTNYETLQMKPVMARLLEWRPEIIVFDESHKLKSPSSARSKLAVKLAELARHRYILTGSPILNGSMDIWAQYRILDLGATFDKNFFAFRAIYFEDKNAHVPKANYFPKWRARSGIEQQLNAKIYAKASRVLKQDCMDLPPLVRTRVEVEMGKDQARCYVAMAQAFIAYLESKECVARLALTQLLRLQQITSGHLKAEDGTVTRFKDVPRLDTLLDLVGDLTPAHKVIVWACFREDALMIKEALAAARIQAVELVGGMTPKAQQEAMDAFQTDPRTRVVVANQQAAGTGITLTAASYAIYYSRNNSLEADLQSESRNYRGGSEIHEKVTRIDLICPKTIDEVVLEALAGKVDLAQRILTLREAYGSILGKSSTTRMPRT